MDSCGVEHLWVRVELFHMDPWLGLPLGSWSGGWRLVVQVIRKVSRGLESIVLGSIRWCVWSLGPSSTFAVATPSILFVYIVQVLRIRSQQPDSCTDKIGLGRIVVI